MSRELTGDYTNKHTCEVCPRSHNSQHHRQQCCLTNNTGAFVEHIPPEGELVASEGPKGVCLERETTLVKICLQLRATEDSTLLVFDKKIRVHQSPLVEGQHGAGYPAGMWGLGRRFQCEQIRTSPIWNGQVTLLIGASQLGVPEVLS